MKTIAQLNARSVVLAKSSKTLAENIHNHMVDIAEHFKAHGDATAATMLFNVLHSAVRRKAVATWFEFYSGMKFVPESKKDGKVKPAHFIRNKEVPFDQIDLEAAASESPWDLEPEPAFKGFDLKKQIAALIKKAEKYSELDTSEMSEDDVKKIAVDESVLAKLKAI